MNIPIDTPVTYIRKLIIRKKREIGSDTRGVMHPHVSVGHIDNLKVS